MVAAGEVQQDPETVFALVLSFEEEFSRPTLDHMQREVEYILRPFNLQFQWRMGPNDQREQLANVLVSVRMRGKCLVEQSDRPAESFATRVLGHTEMSEGNLLSYCEVDCDGIRSMIRPVVNDESFVQMQNLLGRALGRVLVHEVYHILGGTTRHRRNGVSRAVVTPEELVEGVMRLEPEELETIRRHTFRAPVRVKPPVLADGAGEGR